MLYFLYFSGYTFRYITIARELFSLGFLNYLNKMLNYLRTNTFHDVANSET